MESTSGLAPLFRQALEEYDRVVSENEELQSSNTALNRRCQELSDELGSVKGRAQAESRASAEAQAALRAQNASLLAKHQAASEQVARLQLQLAKATRAENERVLRDADGGEDGAGRRSGASVASASPQRDGRGRPAEPMPLTAGMVAPSPFLVPGRAPDAPPARHGHASPASGSGRGSRGGSDDPGEWGAPDDVAPLRRSGEGRARAPSPAAAPFASPHSRLLDEIDRSIESVAGEARDVQAPAPVLDAASFFAKLQRELSTDDLTDLMAVLSEFNDRVLTQSEAVRRAGVVLEHYGPIRAEFEAFIRRSGQGSV